jgi:hypothetical protein
VLSDSTNDRTTGPRTAPGNAAIICGEPVSIHWWGRAVSPALVWVAALMVHRAVWSP